MRVVRGFVLPVLCLLMIVSVLSPSWAMAQDKKFALTAMTTPFGTAMYSQTMAFEEVFKKAGSSVDWKAQETPGAMYIIKYLAMNRDKMAAGQVNQVVSISSLGTIPFIIEGRKPFDKLKIPTVKTLFSMPSFVSFFMTFDPEIKSLKDLVGKKVGIAEKSRPFQGVLALRPYFAKLGIWDKIDWQFLGAANSKDAMLNNKIDAYYGSFMGSVEVDADGRYLCQAMAPGAAEMELMNSGRKLHFLPWDPKMITASYDFSKDMVCYPILVKKAAVEGLDTELWGRLAVGVAVGDVSLPDDVVKEIIRVRHQFREELGKYHATLKLLPESPYPIGTPEKWVHPGVVKAMKELGLPIP